MDSKSKIVSYNFKNKSHGLYNVSLDPNRFSFWMLKNNDQVKNGEPRLNCVEIILTDQIDKEGLKMFFQQAIELLNQKEQDKK
jgi:hypothetical protein